MADFCFDTLRESFRREIGTQNYTERVDTALQMAFDAHDGQYRLRPDRGAERVPFIVHPIGVALLVHAYYDIADLTDTYDDMICAALTHDILEDTDVTARGLEDALGKKVAGIVISLTKPPTNSQTTRASRSETFIEKVRDAGRSAIFINLCERIQNLSRPKNSPEKILRKALTKARKSLTALYETTGFADSLLNDYKKVLREAKEYLAQLEATEETQNFITFQEAAEKMIRRSESKVLEMHDIMDELTELTNAQFISVQTLEDLVSEMFPDHEESAITEIREVLSFGILSAGTCPSAASSTVLSTGNTIYAIDTKWVVGSPSEELLFISVHPDTTPPWISHESLVVITSFLAERLKVHYKLQISEISHQLSNIGLQADSHIAYASGLTFAQLGTLRQSLDEAAYASDVMGSMLGHHIKMHETDFHVDRSDSRIKDPNSILTKVRARNLTETAELDDIIGFRFVCYTAEDAQQLTQLITSILAPGTALSEGLEIAPENYGNDITTSSDGYEAQHITFFVTPRSGDPIGCEIQIRTTFQDAWASVSHAVMYKKKTTGATKKVLKKLRDIRKDADDILGGL